MPGPVPQWDSLALSPRPRPSMQEMLDLAALATTPVPVVGDVAGLAADGYRFATDPSSRTWGNAGWASLGLIPFVPSMGAMTRSMPSRSIDEVVSELQALAERLGVDMHVGGSKLSESKYLTFGVPPGTKGASSLGGVQIRVSDHGTTSGSGENLMSVRTDRDDIEKRLDVARGLLQFAADPSHGGAISPMKARLRFQKTLQMKGGKRVPNPDFIGND